MKRVILYIISILVVFTFVFPLSISADKPIGVINDFSFESKVVTKAHDLNKADIFALDPFGISESYTEEGYSGSQSIHLKADFREYSNVYSKTKGPVDLDEIVEISFWYKHLPDINEATPFAVLWFELSDGNLLCIIQWPYRFLGLNTEDWTKFDSDIWSYIVYDSDLNIIGGESGPFLLSSIQEMFDGMLLKNEGSVGIAAGFWGYYCNALVDDLTIITQKNSNKAKK